VHTKAENNPKLDTSDLANGLIAYGLNRRLMIEVISNYQWNNGSSDSDGASGGFLHACSSSTRPTSHTPFRPASLPPTRASGRLKPP
jgi:hypothetical protein